MKFREQRGGLNESLKTLVELRDKQHLISHCQKILAKSHFRLQGADIGIKLYNPEPDTRVGWERTYVVTAKEWGVIGFVDTLP